MCKLIMASQIKSEITTARLSELSARGTIQINRTALSTIGQCSDACSYMWLPMASEDKQMA